MIIIARSGALEDVFHRPVHEAEHGAHDHPARDAVRDGHDDDVRIHADHHDVDDAEEDRVHADRGEQGEEQVQRERQQREDRPEKQVQKRQERADDHVRRQPAEHREGRREIDVHAPHGHDVEDRFHRQTERCGLDHVPCILPPPVLTLFDIPLLSGTIARPLIFFCFRSPARRFLWFDCCRRSHACADSRQPFS